MKFVRAGFRTRIQPEKNILSGYNFVIVSENIPFCQMRAVCSKFAIGLDRKKTNFFTSRADLTIGACVLSIGIDLMNRGVTNASMKIRK